MTYSRTSFHARLFALRTGPYALAVMLMATPAPNPGLAQAVLGKNRLESGHVVGSLPARSANENPVTGSGYSAINGTGMVRPGSATTAVGGRPINSPGVLKGTDFRLKQR
jgi:hypothetical protein